MNHIDTQLLNAGRDPAMSFGMVNPPICRASTFLFKGLQQFEDAKKHLPGQYTYGRYGTPTTASLEAAMNELEQGAGTALYPSGLAAIAGTLTALLAPGDHLLITDNVYGPVRKFVGTHLARMGIEGEYFDPRRTSLAELIRPTTRVVYLEAPGSLTFEMHDVQALCQSASKAASDITVVMDNTWSTPLFYRPLEHGVDVVIEAATKYLGGHSDTMLGTATANAKAWEKIEGPYRQFGYCVGADDAYTILRGLRTLAPRLRLHESNALALAHWFNSQPEVNRVLHPALESHPDHAIWRNNWSGSSGLFGVVFKPMAEAAHRAFFDDLAHFGLGGSWGGYESLLFPDDPARHRSATPWPAEDRFLRVHAGLEDIRDLLADLDEAFSRLRRAAAR